MHKTWDLLKTAVNGTLNNITSIKELKAGNGIIANPVGITNGSKIAKTTKSPNDYLSASNNKSMFITSPYIGEIITVVALQII